MRTQHGRLGAGAPEDLLPLRPLSDRRLTGAQEQALHRLGASLPTLIRSALVTAERGGSVTVSITAVRMGDSDLRLGVEVTVTPISPPEVERILSELTDHHRGSSGPGLPLVLSDQQLLRRVVGQILAGLADEEFDVSRLAAGLHMSPSKLGRKLRALLDRSPAQLIRLVRLLRARQLMDSGDASLSRIAYDCGFSEQAHFSRAFRHHFGFAPSKLKRRHAEAAPPPGRTATG